MNSSSEQRPLSKLLSQGIVPDWAQPANPDRVDELIEIEAKRELTPEEDEELINLLSVDGPPAPKEHEDYVMRGVWQAVQQDELNPPTPQNNQFGFTELLDDAVLPPPHKSTAQPFALAASTDAAETSGETVPFAELHISGRKCTFSEDEEGRIFLGPNIPASIAHIRIDSQNFQLRESSSEHGLREIMGLGLAYIHECLQNCKRDNEAYPIELIEQ